MTCYLLIPHSVKDQDKDQGESALQAQPLYHTAFEQLPTKELEPGTNRWPIRSGAGPRG